MHSRDFVYWLQGFFEISNADCMTAQQVEMVKKHLNLVFVHEIDPAMGPKQHQEKLNNAHGQYAGLGHAGLGHAGLGHAGLGQQGNLNGLVARC